MRVREDFPRPVRVVENDWIPLSDGTRLAARLWLPEDSEHAPVPAIFEYLPYRKRDFTRKRDEPMHHYFAGHGYASVRVDLRGSGDSDGLLTDEYTVQEQHDALEVLRWIADQPWCTGAVGMMGISWGGFNALQVAAHRPPQLKAIITMCASDDRYADDAHYMGGCLLNENLQWGSVLMHFNAMPPDPELSGSAWREKWFERLQHATCFPALWLSHQHRDAYWQQGSVCEDFSRIVCPVYAIGGWADGYSNAVPRLLAGLQGPRKGLIGPWAHAFPHLGVPGPRIGFLQEALRWWDHWLHRRDTGIMDEPMYRVWMQDSVAPQPFYETRPGRWIAERAWPSPRIEKRRVWLNARTLSDAPEAGRPRSVRSLQTTGLCGGDWCAFGDQGEMPTDQRPDDGHGLVFDGPPLNADLEILGAPVVELDLAADHPQAIVAVRLNDVAPDGASLRVTYGVLNLTHRDGHAEPCPLEPGKRTRVRVQLNDIAHAFPTGHRLRVAISTSYWPMVWPAPCPVRITVHPGTGFLELPVRPRAEEDQTLRVFEAPEQGPEMDHAKMRPGRFRRAYERDLATNRTVYTIFSDEAEFEGASLARIEETATDLAYAMMRRYTIGERDPLEAVFEMEQKTLFQRGDWRVRIETQTALSAELGAFRVRATVRAYEGDREVFVREWDETLARDYL